MAFTIPGLGSGMDIESMVDNILVAKMNKYNKYKKQQTLNTYKEDVFGDLRASVEKLQKTSKALSNPALLLQKKATSSSNAVGVTSTKDNALEGNYVVDVRQLATSSSVALKPTATITDPTQVINSTGGVQEFTYSVNGKDRTIQVADGATMQDLVNSINGDSSNLGVRASLIKDGNEYAFRIQSTSTGASNSISIKDTANGLTGFGSTEAWDIQAGQDAMYKIDGYPSGSNWIHSSSNTVSDAVPGVTLNFQSAGASTITVGTSSEKMVEKIEEFVADVNSVLSMVNDITKPQLNAKSPYESEDYKPSFGDGYKVGDHSSLFYNNSYLKRIQGTMEKLVTTRLTGFDLYDSTAGTGDVFSSLGNIGISFDSNNANKTYGQLVIDKEKLEKAIADNPESVANLIGADGAGSVTSTDNSFQFGSSIKNVTAPGKYDVAYEIDASGSIINATIGGEAAVYDAKTNTLTVSTGEPKGLAIVVTDFTPGKAVKGSVSIREGAATSMANAITDMFITDGDMARFSEEVKKEITSTNKLLESENKRLQEERERLMARFTLMDIRVSEMNSQLGLLGSYIGMSSSGT